MNPETIAGICAGLALVGACIAAWELWKWWNDVYVGFDDLFEEQTDD